MTYMNFTKIAPPAPNDPNVNEVTQLNNNWDQLDSKLQPYMLGGTITLTDVGQEFFDPSFHFGVFDGTSQILPDDIPGGWSAWTALPMGSTRAVRSGFTPRWRNNPLYRMVELSGGINFDASANPWTMGSLQLLNADSSGSPPLSMVPVGGKFVGQCATALTGGTSVTAGAYIVVDAGANFVRMQAQYLGGGGGGNFIELDQVWWWY